MSVDISEKERKRPRDKAALKSNWALVTVAGASARVQAQRRNKEEGSWMRGRGEGGRWR